MDLSISGLELRLALPLLEELSVSAPLDRVTFFLYTRRDVSCLAAFCLEPLLLVSSCPLFRNRECLFLPRTMVFNFLRSFLGLDLEFLTPADCLEVLSFLVFSDPC